MCRDSPNELGGLVAARDFLAKVTTRFTQWMRNVAQQGDVDDAAFVGPYDWAAGQQYGVGHATQRTRTTHETSRERSESCDADATTRTV
jgi:hypothetical protein